MNIKLNPGGCLLATVGILGTIVVASLGKSKGGAGTVGAAFIVGLIGGAIGNAIWSALFPPKPAGPMVSQNPYAGPFVPESPSSEAADASPGQIVMEKGLLSIAAFLGGKGFVTTSERSFLESVRREWGLPEASLQKALGLIRTRKAEVWIPPEPADRDTLMGVLVRSAALAGKIDEDKRTTLRDIAAAAQIPAEKLEKLLNEAIPPK